MSRYRQVRPHPPGYFAAMRRMNHAWLKCMTCGLDGGKAYAEYRLAESAFEAKRNE